MLHPETPDDARVDPHLYAAWRYGTLGRDDAAVLKLQGVSVAAILAMFRDE